MVSSYPMIELPLDIIVWALGILLLVVVLDKEV